MHFLMYLARVRKENFTKRSSETARCGLDAHECFTVEFASFLVWQRENLDKRDNWRSL